MNPNKALWEKGDFTCIAKSMRESGETLVQRLGITKGLKVLDLGCGDGTTALPAAKLGAMCWASILLGISLRLGTSAPESMASPTAHFKKAMRPIYTSCRIRRLISS
jgi:hypothetical protein